MGSQSFSTRVTVDTRLRQSGTKLLIPQGVQQILNGMIARDTRSWLYLTG